jgi:histidine ammonia-lyase
MSAAVQCADILEQMFTIMTYQSVVLAQALDLRGVELQGSSASLYSLIRAEVPFVANDQPLGGRLAKLRGRFIGMSSQAGEVGC